MFFTGGSGVTVTPRNKNEDNNLLNGLISYWELNEVSGTRYDSHGSNDLTDNNTVTSAGGKIGNAASFVATNSEYLSVASNSSLQTGDIDFTLCAWVYLASTGGQRPIMGKWDGFSPTVEYLLFGFEPSDIFTFIVRDSSDTTNTNIQASTFGAPSTSTWYFVVAWHDSVANTLNIQVNNGTVDSSSYSSGVKSGTQAFWMGRNAANYMDGRIDGAGMWKRVLTSSERADLYNKGNGRPYSYFR